MSDAIVLWRVIVLYEKWLRPDVVIAAIAMFCLTVGGEIIRVEMDNMR